MESAIYKGVVRHRRFSPRQSEFSYSSRLFYLDLDELPDLFKDEKFWSLDRINLGMFLRKDYLGDPRKSLRDAVCAEALRLTGSCPTGPIRMLTGLRVFGFCFNPVSFYYLFDGNNVNPSLILAQVNNTPWNERHVYAVSCNSLSTKVSHTFAKDFHVSPFNPIDMTYKWNSTSPAAQLVVHMENYLQGNTDHKNLCHMDATLSLSRVAWSSRELNYILWREPWLSLKVPIAIYWQALKLWLKRTPIYDHQQNPPPVSSLVDDESLHSQHKKTEKKP